MMPDLIAIAMLVFIAGYGTQRGSICVVAAAREWVDDRRFTRLTGFMLCAMSALAVMALHNAVGGNVFSLYTGLAITPLTLAGSVIFALGAWLNRRCSLGTVAELAAGDMTRLATIGGFIAGSWATWRIAGQAMGAEIPSPMLMLPPWLPLAVGAAGALLLGLWLKRQLAEAPRPRFWSPIVTMLVIGTASGGLFCLDQEWPYTTLLNEIARGEADELPKRLAFFGVLLLGAAVAAWRGALFRLRLGTAREWPRALSGGLIMGGGAALVPGGNDAMLLTGIPLLLPNLAAAYVVSTAVLLLICWLERRPGFGRLAAMG